MAVPSNMDLSQAGGLPEAWITAFLLLDLARIQKGDVVLVYAGASGVASAAI
jgi:NADPH:quinone reductase-like Zn-dependent oxidoreductase